MPERPLRPEYALELLRGAVVQAGGTVHFLPTPADTTCRGVRLRCKRVPESYIQTALEDETTVDGGGGSSNRNEVKDGNGRFNVKGDWRARAEGDWRGAGSDDSRPETGSDVGGAGEGRKHRRSRANEGSDRRMMFVEGESVRGQGRRAAQGKKRGGGEAWTEADGWAYQLREWGMVGTSTEVVVPDKAMEVYYNDARTDFEGEATWFSRGRRRWFWLYL